jgi:hypothetical protein
MVFARSVKKLKNNELGAGQFVLGLIHRFFRRRVFINQIHCWVLNAFAGLNCFGMNFITKKSQWC